MASQDNFSTSKIMMDTSEGPVEIPSFYNDGSTVTAFFWCDYETVVSKLEGTGLVPAKGFNGKAIVVLCFFEYRDSSFGPYNEILLMTAVYPDSTLPWWSTNLQFFKNSRDRRLGFYVIDLPLTAALPLAAGREIWGLPKFIADIAYSFSKDTFEANVSIPETGEKIISFKSPFNKGLLIPIVDNTFYSNHEDSIIKIIVNVNFSGKITTGRKVKVAVGSVKHRMAQNLHDLGLDGARPFFLQTSDQLRSRLNSGVKVKSWKSHQLPYGI